MEKLNIVSIVIVMMIYIYFYSISDNPTLKSRIINFIVFIIGIFLMLSTISIYILL